MFQFQNVVRHNGQILFLAMTMDTLDTVQTAVQHVSLFSNWQHLDDVVIMDRLWNCMRGTGLAT